MDPELEAIIEGFRKVRSKVPPDQLAAFDEWLKRAIYADTPAERLAVMQEMADPEGALTPKEIDRFIAEASGGDELLPKRLRQRARRNCR